MPNIENAPRCSISVQLYNDLLTGIQVGDYPPLSSLPTEAALAYDYGVSRTIVRSALSVLKKDGIIVSRQGSGTIVAPIKEAQVHRSLEINTHELRDCYKCRETIEPEIAACAAIKRTTKDLCYLKEQLMVIEDELGLGVTHTGNDANFHVQLARMTGNQFFETIINSLRPHILIGMNFSKNLPVVDRKKHQRASLKEHRAIAEAVVDGNSDAAKVAMAQHLAKGQRRIFAGQ